MDIFPAGYGYSYHMEVRKAGEKTENILTVIILAFYLVFGALSNDTTSTTAFLSGLQF